MIMAKRLVSLLNSSILGNLFELENKETGDFIDKYFTRAKETCDRSDVLEPKSVATSSKSDVSVLVNYNKSEELEEELH